VVAVKEIGVDSMTSITACIWLATHYHCLDEGIVEMISTFLNFRCITMGLLFVVATSMVSTRASLHINGTKRWIEGRPRSLDR